jgi:hypothetical protein
MCDSSLERAQSLLFDYHLPGLIGCLELFVINKVMISFYLDAFIGEIMLYYKVQMKSTLGFF